MKTGVIKGISYAVVGFAAVATASSTGLVYATTDASEINAKIGAGETQIVLDDDVSGGITIPTGKDVTIDLSGYKISSGSFPLNINGNLTLKDSAGTGSVESAGIAKINKGSFTVESGVLTSTGSNAINNTKGTFTMNGGKLTAATYGIGLFDGGTATVNAGEITSKYAAISGNNTTGDMNVYIKGGAVTATGTPAIYMPSQVTLDVSGGTINGGVLIRMGQVSVSGGTINSSSSTMSLTTTAPGNIPAYAYSGMMNLPNAITVMGGAYTSSNETYGNSLNMKITGGTIKSKNGAAVAVYDLGKVSQKMAVAISGGAFTGAAGKDAVVFQSLEQAGIEPVSGYGVVENTLPSAMITGGTYSVEPLAEYIADDYEARADGDAYTVMTKEVAFDEVATEDGTTVDFGEGYVLDRDAKLVVNDATNDDILALNGNIKKALDIHVENENGDELSVTNTNLTISVPLSEELLGYNHYVVYYINDNGEIAETLAATVNNGVLTFNTTHLSVYAIAAYNDDTETATSTGVTLASATINPNTLDNGVNYMVMAGVAAVVMVGAITYLMRQEA